MDDTFRFVVSTGAVDGNGNQADIDGWDLVRYRANPIVFFNHHWHDLPVGRSLSLDVKADQIVATIQFAPTAVGQELAHMVRSGYISGASVAYKPLVYELRTDSNGWPIGVHSHRQELREISVVGLPADADTLRKAFLETQTQADRMDLPDFTLTAMDAVETLIGTVPPRHPPLTADPDLEQIIAALRTYNQRLRGIDS